MLSIFILFTLDITKSYKSSSIDLITDAPRCISEPATLPNISNILFVFDSSVLGAFTIICALSLSVLCIVTPALLFPSLPGRNSIAPYSTSPSLDTYQSGTLYLDV